MPDSVPSAAAAQNVATPQNPAPQNPAEDPAKPRPRGYFRKDQLADIDLAETILTAALDPAHADGLAEEDITPAFLEALQETLGLARAKITATGQGADRKIQATRAAVLAQEALVRGIQGIQSAAKQRARAEALDQDPATNFEAAGYLIGQRLDANRESLLQNATTLIGKAKTETLPGHKAPRIAALEALLVAYRDSETAQGTTLELTGDELIARDRLVTLINNRRAAIQHAADRLYPHYKPESLPARRTFDLPPDRSLGI